MTSASAELPTLRSMPSVSAAADNRRSYSCYNCNYSFHITPTPSTSAASPSSFRCPSCHHRHLIPHHIISLVPPPPPPPPPLPRRSSDFASADSPVFVYQSDDESDSDEDYDSDNSLLSFTTPTFHSATPALKSFVASLPIKSFSPNSTLTLHSCSICMEEFEINPNNMVINELPCEHYFHKVCIVEWLQRSNTCPLCRYKLPVDSNGGGNGDEVEGEIEGSAPVTSQWEVEYGTVLVVDLAPFGMIDSERRGDAGESLGSNAPALGSDRLVLNVDDRESGGFDFDAMRDEDGDTLMVDA